MKTVFLSSGVKGLETYRDEISQAIERLDGFHCIRMEDFGARDSVSDEFCQEKVKASDIFVALLGHRYGSCVPGSEQSYSEREYDVATESGKPRLVFLADDDFPLLVSLREPDQLRDRQVAFRAKVQRERVARYFKNPQELAIAVVQGIHNIQSVQAQSGKQCTRLLFPYVSNQMGFDTGIAVTNGTADGLSGVPPQAGACTVNFYGKLSGDITLRSQEHRFAWTQRSSVIWPGEQLTFTLSGGAEPKQLITAAAGFQGYLVIDCEFAGAYGFAYFGPIGTGAKSVYIAERIMIG